MSKTLGTLHSASFKRNGEPIKDWNFRFFPSGLRNAGSPVTTPGPISSWVGQIQTPELASFGTGTLSAVSWRNTLALEQSGTARVQWATSPTYGEVTEMGWLFELQIPTSTPGGNGPVSTFNDPLKNYPLYFKAGAGGMVMGSQPISSNCDMNTNIASWHGLDAVILVQQGGGLNPRFSCWVDTLGPLQFVATTGEDPSDSAAVEGLSIGGWYNTGGEYPYPIAQVSNISRRPSDLEADAEVAYFAAMRGFSGA